MRPNLQDIADAAGVGKSTVSLALRNDPRLRVQTRERIQKMAREMGYQRNTAVSMAMAQIRSRDRGTGRANLGILNVSPQQDALEMISTSREWRRGCEKRGKELSYALESFWLFEPGVRGKQLLHHLESRHIQGLLVGGLSEHRELPPEFEAVAKKFPCVAVGVRVNRPRLHCCVNDPYATARRAAREVMAAGYEAPALVIAEQVDQLVDGRYSAGFLSAVREHAGSCGAPVFDFEEENRAGFDEWIDAAKPDVIVTRHDPVHEWLIDGGRRIPGDMGFAHLDLLPEHEERHWAGMHQNRAIIGARALDLLVGQIDRNETGVPNHRSCVLIESTWRAGETIVVKN